ncbi:MAG: glycosyltransferase [Proteobacteria bacterium]|nr:glycosyltransferase [Pseudomonadota bacterium]
MSQNNRSNRPDRVAGFGPGPSLLSRFVRLIDLDVELADPDGTLAIDRPGWRATLWWRERPIGHVEGATPPDGLIEIRDLLAHTDSAALAEARQRAAETPPAPVSLSVVVCTRDRPTELARCLDSLRRQTRPADEIVVVDNGSADARTREAAEAHGARYVREDRVGLDIARNRGARTATGAIVAYTDDDVIADMRWLERLVAAFDSPAIAVVTGLVLPAELDTEAQAHFETYWGFGRGYRRIDFGTDFFAQDSLTGAPVWQIGTGANMAFRREVFQTVGLFDERLCHGAAGCSGDTEFWHRVLRGGGTCRYEPGAVVRHFHRRDMAALSRQIHSYMRGHAAALLIQYERSGNRGNLRRALAHMPLLYARRLAGHLRHRGARHDRFLWQEIGGYVSGLLYYLRAPRPR